MLATLLLSLGAPMLLGGDERGRSQAGNNNAYCQDGPVSWYDWTVVDTDLLASTRRLLSRRAHPHSGGGGSCEVPDPARSTGSLPRASR